MSVRRGFDAYIAFTVEKQDKASPGVRTKVSYPRGKILSGENTPSTPVEYRMVSVGKQEEFNKLGWRISAESNRNDLGDEVAPSGDLPFAENGCGVFVSFLTRGCAKPRLLQDPKSELYFGVIQVNSPSENISTCSCYFKDSSLLPPS